MNILVLNRESTIIKYLEKVKDSLICNEEKFEKIWNLKPDKKPKVKIFGKLIEVPRYYQNYGYNYNFSGVNNSSLEIPDLLKDYINYCIELEENENKVDKDYKWGILVNWYDDGKSYIGYHSDDEKELKKNSNIYCFSLGDDRDFCLKCKNTGKVTKLKLKNNSLVIMCGSCQETHKHSIPKRVKGNRRISITIRKFMVC